MPMTSSDHDVLVKLDANFDTFVKQYSFDMKDLKDGYSLKFTDHEARLKILERLVEITSPEKTYKEFEAVKQQLHDFKNTWKFVVAISVGLGGVVGWLLATFTSIMGWFKQ